MKYLNLCEHRKVGTEVGGKTSSGNRFSMLVGVFEFFLLQDNDYAYMYLYSILLFSIWKDYI